MPAEILRPLAQGFYANLAATGSGIDHEQVNEAVADDDTSYVSRSNGTAYSDFRFSTALTTETITAVDCHYRARCTSDTGGEFATAYATFDDVTYPAGATNDLGDSYDDYEDPAFPRPGGGSWVPADFTDTSPGVCFGIELTGTATSEARCTQFYLEVTFEAPAASAAKAMHQYRQRRR